MRTDKYICVVVKSPWFVRGEHRHTMPMPNDFVSQVQIGDEVSFHLMFRHFVPFDDVVKMMTDDAKLDMHHSANETIKADSNVSYNDALEATYTDWVSRRTWEVTKRKWCLNLGNGETFLEITIEVKDNY